MPTRPSSFACGMLAGAGLLALGVFLGGAAAGPDATDVLRTRRLEIVDEVGTTMVVLGSNDEGGAVSVSDRLGRPLVVTGAGEHGGVLIVRRRGEDVPAFSAAALEHGGALQLFADDGSPAFEVRSTDEAARLALYADGKPSLISEASAGQGASLALNGRSGDVACRLAPDSMDKGTLTTFNARTGLPLTKLYATGNDHGQIRTFAANGVPLVTITASAQDEGQMYTADAQGRSLVAIATRPAGPTIRIYNLQGEPAIVLETDEEGHGAVHVSEPPRRR